MAFVNVVGLGNSLARRRAVARFRIPLHRRRGVGDDLTLPDGTRIPDPTTYKGQVYASQQAEIAYDYPQAPGCHVVDLSRNACLNIDGTERGCNSMPECDPLTNALHFQYPLLTPVNTGIPALKTGNFTPSIYTDRPNPNLRNPTSGGQLFTPYTEAATQAAIAAALGKDTTAAFKAAVAGNPPAGNTPGSNAPGSNTPGGSPSGAPSGAFDFLTNPVSIFGFSVPTWGVFAAVGAGIFAFAGKHR